MNPRVHFLMQFPDDFQPKTFRLAALFEVAEKNHELCMGQFVLRMRRAAIAFHALLLVFEMTVGVKLQEINQMN